MSQPPPDPGTKASNAVHEVPTQPPADVPTSVFAPAGGTSALMLPCRFGRYEVRKLLGKGGMGAVYLAHDPQLDRSVALKIPSFAADESDELAARFVREARAAATINHPGICPVYDVGTIDGVMYLTMAFLEGQPLSASSKAGSPCPRTRRSGSCASWR